MKYFVLSLLAGSLRQASASAPRRSLINGGQYVDQDMVDMNYPWFVVFVRTSDCQAFCGGALVGPSTVLTAAHCFFDKPDAGLNNPSVRAVIGYAGPVNTPQEPDNIDEECDLRGMYNIASVIKPAYYQYQYGFDLALVSLQIDDKCPDVTTIPMVGLNYDLRAWVNSHFTLLGFGATQGEIGVPSPDLKSLQRPVSAVGTADEHCNLHVPVAKRIPSFVCSYERDDEQGAQGDSGGPWILYDATLRTHVLTAVESSGDVNNEGISYASLISPAWFQDWIASTILTKDSCLPNPLPKRDSFFVGFGEYSKQQFCTFDDCSVCSDSVVTNPNHVKGKPGPRIEACLRSRVKEARSRTLSSAREVVGSSLKFYLLSFILFAWPLEQMY